MNSQPSSAIENGLTSQLTPTVAAMPRQWLLHLPERGEVDLQQHRHDHQPDQHRDRQIDLRHRRRAERMEHARHSLAERDADDDAERDPERQVALERPHGGRLAGRGSCSFAHGAASDAVAARVDDRFAIFLGERAALRIGKNIQHRLGRPAELHALAASRRSAG